MSQYPNPDPWAQGQQSQPGPQDAAPGYQQGYPGYQQGIPMAPQVPAGYGYAGAPMTVPPGMWYDAESGLVLPEGVQLATVGRRIGAFFLAIPLTIVTLFLGYFIWGAVAWGSGRSPALQTLGMRCWKPAEGKPATWGTMALRNIIGGFVQGLFLVMPIVSFIMFLTGKQRKTLADSIGGTVVLYDPNKVLDTWQRF